MLSTIKCTNPFTNKVIGEFDLENFEQQSEKVHLLKLSQKSWNMISLEQRIETVTKALKYFEIHKDEVAKDISEQMGRPLHQCYGEIKGLFERANYLLSIAKESLTTDIFTDKEGFIREIEHSALGTIFIVSAWNFPLLITINSVIPALLAGNTILLKHSSVTPKIGMHFERAFNQMANHQNLLLHSIINHEVTGKVIEELAIDHVIFTGSVTGGKEILKHTSKRFINPTLELGGKDAAYLHYDADIDTSLDTIIDGCMFNAGQSCCGIERLYVHKDIYDSVIEKCKPIIEAYKLGDPKDENVNMGPLAQVKSIKYLEEQMADAIEKGAIIHLGGKRIKIGEGQFFSPTLMSNVDHSMLVMVEENFAPILPIMKVESMDEAIKWMNDSKYGLTSAVFTKDLSIAKKMAQNLETGTVFMNRCDYLDPALPWSGLKNSGCGFSLSKYAFHNVTRKKSIHFKL